MKSACFLACLTLFALATAGCGKTEVTSPAASAPPPVPMPSLTTDQAAPPPAPAPGAAAPPQSPESSEESSGASADVLAAYRDPQWRGVRVSDLEALQAAVDDYAYQQVQPDGTAWPAPQDLTDLVKRGILKRVPEAPPGKKWAYDPNKWKVSLVNQ